MKKLLSILVAVFLIAAILGSSASAQGEYTIADLGKLPGGEYSAAYAINDIREVVGESTVSTGYSHAFWWRQSEGMQDLGTLGGNSSYAADINNLSLVVGWSETYSWRNHAFLWTTTRGMRDLGTLGGYESVAESINDLGQVIGWSSISTSSRTPHAFLWTELGGMQDLGTPPGGDWSQATSINNLGQVVGRGGSSTGTGHVFLWTFATGMQDLGTLPGLDSCDPVDINDLGQVVGSCCDIEWCATRRAFLWTEATGMQDIGTLFPKNINNLSQVVGWGSSAIPGMPNAYLWTQTAGMQNLGTLPGGNLSRAEGINNLGQVVGLSNTTAGEAHAVLWEPPLPFIVVSIDIKPKAAINAIDLRQKTVSVAVLSSASFNAVTQIVRSSLTFGRTGNEESLYYAPRTGKLACSAADMNGDRLKDLVCSFVVAKTGFQCGDTQGILKGRLVDGAPVLGQDTVKILPCH